MCPRHAALASRLVNPSGGHQVEEADNRPAAEGLRRGVSQPRGLKLQ